MTDLEKILDSITAALKGCPGVQGIVLGGSQVTGTAGPGSDLDIGVYYDRETLDLEQLNALAKTLDDKHRENLVCPEGGWGPWVNCGGWLAIGGVPVDLILRDVSRVKKAVESAERGEFSAHYQTGHPHAFLDVMYRGELASSRLLYAKNEEFSRLKGKAEPYPPALKESLIRFFGFEAGFSCMLAEKSLTKGDLSYVAGHLFRSVSAMNQALFALNGQWCLNEKKAALRVDSFAQAPGNYSQRVNRIFRSLGGSPGEAVRLLQELCGEMQKLCAPYLDS
ncbi:MAG TPA: nucleotidyltransferase domain-containing protein [Candidatus Merdivicinus intestinigallinarum]|nr:nucleotidyltransferase domain-containing protein [Candidatus Merdivicinus intestinigallinarum]